MTTPGSIVVIGASAGGVDALRAIVAALSPAIDAALFVTLHIGAHKSELPWLLDRLGTLSASHPSNGEAIRAGHLFVAPPDHHLTIETGKVVLTRGPRENMARPAIDPMFRSAAQVYGSNVIGVILTGGLNDGTAGLIEIAAHGGTTVVQDPTHAHGASMPQSAIDNVAVDHVVDIAAIGPLLTRLVGVRTQAEGFNAKHGSDTSQEADMAAKFTLDRPVAVTCPDCGGALRQGQLGSLTQYRCHIGHVYTAEVVLAGQFLAMERFIEQALRSLGERGEMCRAMVEKTQAIDPDAAGQWQAAMEQVLDRTAILRDLLALEWLHPVADGATLPTPA